MSGKSEKRKRRPSHCDLFDWRDGKPFRWKDNFPLQPVLKPRGEGFLKAKEPD
ncbi:hypothetical protein ACFL59_04865 [Planctomycetota bacterium]